MKSPPSHYMIALAVCLMVSSACSDCRSRQEATSPGDDRSNVSRIFESPLAPYRLEVGEGWERVPPESINADADFAATFERRFYAIVIPQRLPNVEGVDTLDLESLEEASLARLKQNTEGFEVERRGPVRLDDRPAISVFAEGRTDEGRAQFVVTYAIHRGWGFQLIAWGPAKRDAALIPEVDRLFEGWKFVRPSVQSPSSDAESASDGPADVGPGEPHHDTSAGRPDAAGDPSADATSPDGDEK